MKIPIFTHNQEVVKAYVTFLELQDKKPQTIKNRLFSILPFFQKIKEKDVKDITKTDVEDYVSELKKGKLEVPDSKTGNTRALKLLPGSIHNYLFGLKYFLKWAIPGNEFFKDIKIKRQKTDHSRDEYPNIEDVKKMLDVCDSQRDRTFVFVLWESAGRLEEVLRIDIEDIRPEAGGVTVRLAGKTGEREVLLIDAAPDILRLLNLIKKEKGPLFTTTAGRRLSHTGTQTLIGRIAKKAGITEKRHNCHAFRHGRITELANAGMPEAQLRLFAGWQSDSDMPSTYIHTKKKDVYNKLRKLKGIEEEEETGTLATDTLPKKCPSCGTENPFDAVACYKCRAVLSTKLAVEIANRENERQQTINELKKEIERLKEIEKSRTEDMKIFKEIIDEQNAQEKAVEEATGTDFGTAAEIYDVGAIVPPDSENMKAHIKRLKTDKEYKARWKAVTHPGEFEKQRQAAEKKILSTLFDKL